MLPNCKRPSTPCLAVSAMHFESDTRGMLQGHRNTITCLAATNDRSLLITGDAGTHSLLVFWDPATGQPIRTLQQPHAVGVVAVAVAADGSQIATLSAVDESSSLQEVGVNSSPPAASQINVLTPC